MELNLATGSETVQVSDTVFARPFSEDLVHQVVTAYLSHARAGTKAQKSRADVRGGGRKPWRQKGTGRARAGTIRSPLWNGGGVTFAARPRKFAPKVNRKMFRAAMQAIFSELVRQERLVVIDDVSLDKRNTKALLKTIADNGVQPEGLLVAAQADDNLTYSARNVPGLHVATVGTLSPVELVGSKQVLITRSALEKIEGWLA